MCLETAAAWGMIPDNDKAGARRSSFFTGLHALADKTEKHQELEFPCLKQDQWRN